MTTYKVGTIFNADVNGIDYDWCPLTRKSNYSKVIYKMFFLQHLHTDSLVENYKQFKIPIAHEKPDSINQLSLKNHLEKEISFY